MKELNLNKKYEYCPNGNIGWIDISGIFDKKTYLFCDCRECKGQVYELRPINITQRLRAEVIEDARKEKMLFDIKNRINYKNMEEVKKLVCK